MDVNCIENIFAWRTKKCDASRRRYSYDVQTEDRRVPNNLTTVRKGNKLISSQCGFIFDSVHKEQHFSHEQKYTHKLGCYVRFDLVLCFSLNFFLWWLGDCNFKSDANILISDRNQRNIDTKRKWWIIIHRILWIYIYLFIIK